MKTSYSLKYYLLGQRCEEPVKILLIKYTAALDAALNTLYALPYVILTTIMKQYYSHITETETG